MKEYRIRVLLNSGSTSYFGLDTIIKGELAEIGDNYYCFKDDNGRFSYYPIINTIVEEQ